MARTTKTPEAAKPVANPPVTFNREEMDKIVAAAVAEAIEKQKAKMDAVVATMGNGKGERSMQNEIAVVKAFKRAGFGNVKPHEDVKTFNRWVAAGYRPLEGSKSLKIKNLRLFHKSQVRPITAEEKAALAEQNEAAVARHSAANVTPLHHPQ